MGGGPEITMGGRGKEEMMEGEETTCVDGGGGKMMAAI